MDRGKMKSGHDCKTRIRKNTDSSNPFRVAIDYSEKCDNDCWGDKDCSTMRTWGGHDEDNHCGQMKSWGDCRGDSGCGNMKAWNPHMNMGDMGIDDHKAMFMKMMSGCDGDGSCGEFKTGTMDIDIKKLIQMHGANIEGKIVICEVDESGELKVITQKLEKECDNDSDLCCKTGEKPDENCCKVNPDIKCEGDGECKGDSESKSDSGCDKSGKDGCKRK